MDILQTFGLKSSPKVADELAELQKTSDSLIVESSKIQKKAKILEEIAKSKAEIAEAKIRIKAAGGTGSGVLGKITPKQWVIIAIGVVVIIFLMRSC